MKTRQMHFGLVSLKLNAGDGERKPVLNTETCAKNVKMSNNLEEQTVSVYYSNI